MIRVLVADDSPTARTLMVEILKSDPELTVVGTAKDGAEAVELAKTLRPQLVTMDVEMPRMDGFEATKEIMIEAPTRIVVVTARVEGAEEAVSMPALRAGAVCVVRKPPSPRAAGHATEAQQLLATVKAMAEVKVVRHTRAPGVRARPTRPGERGARVVAIAASTGGPAVLYRILSELPADLAAPVLVVQHISRGFISGLAGWLNAASGLKVRIAVADEVIAPPTVYLAPDDRHLGMNDGRIVLSTAEPIGGFRPSASFLFESVARGYGAGAVAIVLTGMGDDGMAGLRALRAAGGRVLAQDEKTSVVFGMPGAAVAADLADEVLSVEDIAARITALVAAPLLRVADGAFARSQERPS